MDTNNPLTLGQSTGPKYRRLYDALTGAIRRGDLAEGSRLPPVRDLAWDLKITPGTVARAYQMATNEGLLEATVGRGTFVRGQRRGLSNVPQNTIARTAEPNYLNLRTGHTVELGQTDAINHLLGEIIAANTITYSDYVRDDALKPCRNRAHDWLSSHGVTGAAEDMVITTGAHNSVIVALHCILSGRDPVILSHRLTYPGFRQSAHLCRARLVGIDGDAAGPIPESLIEACRRHNPQALLLSSNVHNPTCVTTSLKRREQIADIARKYDLHIVEDDVYGTLVPNRLPGLDTLVPERVWHATSLSKCFAAGLRLGFLQCPPGQGALGQRVLQGMSFSLSALLTLMVERLFATGTVDAIGAKIRTEGVVRLDMARQILANWDIATCEGASLLWLNMPAGWRASAFQNACEKQNILLAAGDAFTLPDEPAPNAIRLSLSGSSDRARLKSGLETINALLAGPTREFLT